MYKLLIAVSVLSTLLLTSPGALLAQSQHGHGAATHDMGGMQTQDVLVQETVIGFAVMANAEHLKMLRDMKMTEAIEVGTTHNITITLKDQKTQQPITDATVSMRVVDPSGKDQIKTLRYEGSMNSYDAYFSMPDSGKYQILVLAKYGDQKKTAGIYYDVH
jgi:hypothetical protein